jgi:hypothetical protein
MRNPEFIPVFNKYHSLIVQHLTAEELMKLGVCRTEINMEIVKCIRCMDKLTVHLREHRDRSMKVFIASKRNYKNFKLSCSHDVLQSNCFISIAYLFRSTLTYLELHSVKIQDDSIVVRFPIMMSIKICSSDEATLRVFLPSCGIKKLLTIENMFDEIASGDVIEEIMRYRTVHLVNVNLNTVSNLDFLYNVCTDFNFGCNLRSDMSALCLLLSNGVRCSELTVKKRDAAGYQLSVHRSVNSADYFVPSSKLYRRKLRRKDMVKVIGIT